MSEYFDHGSGSENTEEATDRAKEGSFSEADPQEAALVLVANPNDSDQI